MKINEIIIDNIPKFKTEYDSGYALFEKVVKNKLQREEMNILKFKEDIELTPEILEGFLFSINFMFNLSQYFSNKFVVEYPRNKKIERLINKTINP